MDAQNEYQRIIEAGDRAFKDAAALKHLFANTRRRELERLDRTLVGVKSASRELKDVSSMVWSVQNGRDRASGGTVQNIRKPFFENAQENASTTSEAERNSSRIVREWKVREAEVNRKIKAVSERAEKAEQELEDLQARSDLTLKERDALKRTVEDMRAKEGKTVSPSRLKDNSDESLQRLIVQLRDTERLRVVAERQLGESIEQAAKQQQAFEDLQEKLDETKRENAVTIEQLHGELAEATGKIASTQHEADAASEDLAAARSKVQALHEAMREKDKRRDEEIETLRRTANQTQQKLVDDLSRTRREFDACSQKLELKCVSAASTSESERNMKARLAVAKDECDSLHSQLAIARQKLDDSQTACKVTAATCSEQQQDLQALQTELNQERVERDKLKCQLDDVMSQLQKERLEFKGRIRELEQISQEQVKAIEANKQEAEREAQKAMAASDAAGDAATAAIARAKANATENEGCLVEIRRSIQVDKEKWTQERSELRQKIYDAEQSNQALVKERTAAKQAQSVAEQKLGAIEIEQTSLREECARIIDTSQKMEIELAEFAKNELESITARIEAERNRSTALEELDEATRENRRLRLRTYFGSWKETSMDWTENLSEERIMGKIDTLQEELASSSEEQSQLVFACQENLLRLHELGLIKSELENELKDLREQHGYLESEVGKQEQSVLTLRQQHQDVQDAMLELRHVARKQDAELVARLCGDGTDETATVTDSIDLDVFITSQRNDTKLSLFSPISNQGGKKVKFQSNISMVAKGLSGGPVAKVSNFAELEERNAVLYAIAKLWGAKLIKAEEALKVHALILRTRREHMELELMVRTPSVTEGPGLSVASAPTTEHRLVSVKKAFDAIMTMVPAFCEHVENDIVSDISRTRRAIEKCAAIRKRLFDTSNEGELLGENQTLSFDHIEGRDIDAYKKLLQISRVALIAQKWRLLREKMIHTFTAEELDFQLQNILIYESTQLSPESMPFGDTDFSGSGVAISTVSSVTKSSGEKETRNANDFDKTPTAGIEIDTERSQESEVIAGIQFEYEEGECESDVEPPETPGMIDTGFPWMGMSPESESQTARFFEEQYSGGASS